MARLEFIAEIVQLQQHAAEPAFIPFLLIKLWIKVESVHLSGNERQASKADNDMLGLAGRASVHFGGSHTRAQYLAGVETAARNLLKRVHRWWRRRGDFPLYAISVNDQQKLDLQNGLKFCAQEVENMIEATRLGLEQSARQLTTALSILAYEQQNLSRQEQQTSIEIAKASRIIAEETKKDGSSMKTVAVVTMLFLPATSISSIFSMPLFNWDAPAGKVVKTTLWIYSVFAVGLTLITVGIWAGWQRKLAARHREALVDKV